MSHFTEPPASVAAQASALRSGFIEAVEAATADYATTGQATRGSQHGSGAGGPAWTIQHQIPGSEGSAPAAQQPTVQLATAQHLTRQQQPTFSALSDDSAAQAAQPQGRRTRERQRVPDALGGGGMRLPPCPSLYGNWFGFGGLERVPVTVPFPEVNERNLFVLRGLRTAWCRGVDCRGM